MKKTFRKLLGFAVALSLLLGILGVAFADEVGPTPEGGDASTAQVIANALVVESDPPANDPPANDPPVNDPPKQDPPANDPPANDPPKQDPPADDLPANDPPANDPPADDLPANDPLANDPPAIDPPKQDTLPPAGNVPPPPPAAPITGSVRIELVDNTSGRYKYGEYVLMQAFVTGFEGATWSLTWEYSSDEGKTWLTAPGDTIHDIYYMFQINESNAHFVWRAVVDIY